MAREQGKPDRTTPAGAGAGGERRRTDGTTPTAAGGAGGRERRPAGERNRLGWIAVTVAGLLTAWQIVYAITAPSVSNAEAYESVGLLLTLVLAVGALVLGIVALSQRVQPRWPAVAALAVGAYAFIVVVVGWIGELMY